MNDNLSSILNSIAGSLRNGGSLAACFSDLRRAAAMLGASGLAKDIDAAESRYFYLLRFAGQNGSFSATADADRIRQDAADLLSAAVCLALEADSTSLKSSQLRFQRRRPEENIESLVSDFLSEQDRLRTDPVALTDSRANARLEQIATDIFKRVWATDPVSADEERLLETIIADDALPFYFRMLIVNAIGLGMEPHLQSWRMRLLQSAAAATDSRIAIAAEVWLVLSAAMSGDTEVLQIPLPHIADIYHALVRAAMPSTGKMPDLMSIGRKMKDNPLEKPDISTEEYEAIKRVQNAQARGEDVFASTLGRLRQFPFFNETANWFLPFHSSHSALADIVDGEGAAVADMIERMPMLVDTDKYAMVLSMAAMPAGMRSAALGAMVDNIRQLSDTEEFREAIEASKPTEKMIVGQTVNTIFRYLSGNIEGKRTYLAGISSGIVPAVMHLLPEGFDDQADEIELIGSLWRSGEYKGALDAYSYLPNPGQASAPTLCMLADAARHEKRTQDMTAFYRNALALEPANADALTGLATANRTEGREADNVGLLEPYADENAADTRYQLLLGSAYLAAGDIEKAIATFHHLDYISKDNSAKAPLAWALTLAGDYDNAAIFFDEAATGSPSAGFLMRKGIMQWLSGARSEALATLSVARGRLGESAFGIRFSQLARRAVARGAEADILLAPDILRYRDERGGI